MAGSSSTFTESVQPDSGFSPSGAGHVSKRSGVSPPNLRHRWTSQAHPDEYLKLADQTFLFTHSLLPCDKLSELPVCRRSSTSSIPPPCLAMARHLLRGLVAAAFVLAAHAAATCDFSASSFSWQGATSWTSVSHKHCFHMDGIQVAIARILLITSGGSQQ